ncbi:hypothetical protein CRG98_033783 [Punica granatum]|uniref:CCHC-type domain-containing protein n=1 Tax=Punica granatum TaxID=22663 RepID=A0A2I0IQR8_PUNGR|nr:hypothetical protein CRG98_033783 [Punica granatum]
MEGSITDEIYRGPATFSSAAAGASTSDANLEEEQKMKAVVVITKLMEFESLEQFKNVVRDLNISIGREEWIAPKLVPLVKNQLDVTGQVAYDYMIHRLNKDAAKWLNDIPVDKWSRSAFDTVCKNQAVTSNMCEQFNGAILKYRGKPIITMLEGIRMYITSKRETNDKIYSNYINPAAGEGFWEKTGFDPTQPPIVKRKPGKPKTKRKKAPEEDSNPHKMKRKLGPPRCSKCKQVGHKKTSCKANLSDRDTAAATNETRPFDVPVYGANKETRASQVPSRGGSAAAGDGVNDAPTAAQDGHFGPIPSQPELQSVQPLQTDHHTTHVKF